MAKAKNLWLDELNPQQREAVTYGSGPLLVVAGAGSGKTRTLAYRVAHLISQGVSPQRILLLTFTRRAAEEMLRQAASVTEAGNSATSQVWGGTFHSFANRIVRMYAQPAVTRIYQLEIIYLGDVFIELLCHRACVVVDGLVQANGHH